MKKQTIIRHLLRQMTGRAELDESLGIVYQQFKLPREIDLSSVIRLGKESDEVPGKTQRARSSSSENTAEESRIQPRVEFPAVAEEVQKEDRALPPIDSLPFIPNREVEHERLIKEMAQCDLCSLHARRHHVVISGGSLSSELFFIKEAPDREEDLYGQYFVGRGGELLAAMIEKGMGRPRDSVYVTSLIKCRPHHDQECSEAEMERCYFYLERQLQIVRPKVIIGLGTAAGRILTGKRASIRRLRMTKHSYRGIPLVISYDPAHLLQARDRAGGKTQEDRETWEDLKNALALLRGHE